MRKLRDRTIKENRSLDSDRAWKMLGETPLERQERLEREVKREKEIGKEKR